MCHVLPYIPNKGHLRFKPQWVEYIYTLYFVLGSVKTDVAYQEILIPGMNENLLNVCV
jgi:hypothetical protein